MKRCVDKLGHTLADNTASVLLCCNQQLQGCCSLGLQISVMRLEEGLVADPTASDLICNSNHSRSRSRSRRFPSRTWGKAWFQTSLLCSSHTLMSRTAMHVLCTPQPPDQDIAQTHTWGKAWFQTPLLNTSLHMSTSQQPPQTGTSAAAAADLCRAPGGRPGSRPHRIRSHLQ
jgi:hypothetical protein